MTTSFHHAMPMTCPTCQGPPSLSLAHAHMDARAQKVKSVSTHSHTLKPRLPNYRDAPHVAGTRPLLSFEDETLTAFAREGRTLKRSKE